MLAEHRLYLETEYHQGPAIPERTIGDALEHLALL